MGLLSPRAALGSNGCEIPDHLEQLPAEPFVGNLSFYHFNMIISGACTAVVLFMIFGLMGRHAMRMSNPQEQLKIMRVCNMIPSYQMLSFIAICLPNAYPYIQGYTEVFQGIALYSFLMLLCDLMAPDEKSKVEFFSSLEIKRQWQPKKTRNGLAFLKLTWFSVLQYPVITLCTALAQTVTQGLHLYCLSSMKPQFSHIWLQVITSLSTSIAVNAILQFYMNMKVHMKEHKPLQKLMAFKLIVGVVFLEKILFLILEGTKVLKANKVLTYIDVMMGLETMIICVQMVPLCFFVCYAYRTKPYEISNAPRTLRPQQYQSVESDDDETLIKGYAKRYQGGKYGWHAWAVYLNPLDLFQDVLSAYSMITKARALQKSKMQEQVMDDAQMRRYDSPASEGA
ncbi:hypothetical protein PENSTE_c002G04726 [Penicillium steckii]|uniref:Organic solute transporter Ostalpha-domain-containing protein n=1 Tax=Penicillium steckii TaxID=303698 RepID=A0A1V6TVE9_9EURO|nr:hypothetical protein PENSTE_c002G04726 [Penicillium steckii]